MLQIINSSCTIMSELLITQYLSNFERVRQMSIIMITGECTDGGNKLKPTHIKKYNNLVVVHDYHYNNTMSTWREMCGLTDNLLHCKEHFGNQWSKSQRDRKVTAHTCWFITDVISALGCWHHVKLHQHPKVGLTPRQTNVHNSFTKYTYST